MGKTESEKIAKKIAIKVPTEGGYVVLNSGSNWSSLMTPAQKAQNAFFKAQMDRNKSGA